MPQSLWFGDFDRRFPENISLDVDFQLRGKRDS